MRPGIRHQKSLGQMTRAKLYPEIPFLPLLKLATTTLEATLAVLKMTLAKL